MINTNRKVLVKGDTSMIDLVIINRQIEGHYKYIPREGDDIRLVIYSQSDEQIVSTPLIRDDSGRTYFNIDTSDLEKGRYKYDVIIQTVDEEKPHHIIIGQEIMII